MGHLKLQPEQCSPLGRLILDYVERTPNLTLNTLAKKLEMSRPGLGCVCLKRTTPDEETALKLAHLLNLEEREIARLIYENKLANLLSIACIPNAALHMANLFEAFLKLEELVPVPVSIYQVYKNAFSYMKSRISVLVQ